jgi:hypothetical protein
VLGDLGARMIIDFEARLKNQQELDAADARRIEEEERTKAEAAKLDAEREEKERMEKVRRREQDMLEIAAAERELQARKKALSITDKGADDNDVIEVEDDDDDDDCSDSAADGPPVRLIYSVSLRFILIVIHNYLED